MPEIPDVAPSEPILSGSWGNPIRSRTLQRYASATERDALVPLPESGEAAWLEDSGTLTIYDGSSWLELIDSDGGQTIRTGILIEGMVVTGRTDARRAVYVVGGGSGATSAHVNLSNDGSPGFRGVGIFLVDRAPGDPTSEAFWFLGSPYSSGGRYRIAVSEGEGAALSAERGDMRTPAPTVGIDVLRDGSVITPNALLVGHVAELASASVVEDGEPYTNVSDALAELAARIEAIETALGL